MLRLMLLSFVVCSATGQVEATDNQPSYFGASVRALARLVELCSSERADLKQDETSRQQILVCVKRRAFQLLDRALDVEEIALIPGITLVRNSNNTHEERSEGIVATTNSAWLLLQRIERLARSHLLKIDLSKIKSRQEFETSLQDDIEGRSRRRRRQHLFSSFMVTSLLGMGAFVVPMGFQFLALIGGKALFLSKLALFMTMLQSFKSSHSPPVALHHHPYEVYHRSSSYAPENSFYPSLDNVH